MKKLLLTIVLTAQAGVAVSVWAGNADPLAAIDPGHDTSRFSTSPYGEGGMDSIAVSSAGTFPVTVGGIGNNQPIPSQYAYCVPDGKGGVREGGNISPAVHWFGAPSETKSYALLMFDEDAPANASAGSRSGRHYPLHYPRQNFYHWVMVNIPASIVSLPEGADGKGIVKGGKPTGKTAYGLDGQNDYAVKLGQGKGGGYDGPCPSIDDDRLHHYHFIVYALNVPSLPLTGNFTGERAQAAMTGHILAQGEVTGTFTNSPRLGAR